MTEKIKAINQSRNIGMMDKKSFLGGLRFQPYDNRRPQRGGHRPQVAQNPRHSPSNQFRQSLQQNQSEHQGKRRQADSEEVTRKKARTEAVSHSDIIAIGKAQSESFKAGRQSPTPRPHVTTSVRPRPQRAAMCKICTSLKQPYNVGNIFSDNIHVYWLCVRNIYMVVK